MNIYILYGTNDPELKSAEVLAVTPYYEMIERIGAISDFDTVFDIVVSDGSELPRVGEIITRNFREEFSIP